MYITGLLNFAFDRASSFKVNLKCFTQELPSVSLYWGAEYRTLSMRFDRRIYISDRTHSIPLRLPNMCLTQPLPALVCSILQLPDWLTEQGERLGVAQIFGKNTHNKTRITKKAATLGKKRALYDHQSLLARLFSRPLLSYFATFSAPWSALSTVQCQRIGSNVEKSLRVKMAVRLMSQQSRVRIQRLSQWQKGRLGVTVYIVEYTTVKSQGRGRRPLSKAEKELIRVYMLCIRYTKQPTGSQENVIEDTRIEIS